MCTLQNQLKITTLNVEGLKSNSVYVNSVLSNCDILCLQEHWLLNFELKTINELFPDHNFSAKCMDDERPTLPKFRNRGHAGTAILWDKKIDHIIEPLPDGSDRVTAVKINCEPDPIILINTYMPTSGSTKADYNEILDEVYEILQKYSRFKVLWTGDLNATNQRLKPSKNDDQLRSFCIENDLKISDKMPSTPTFHHFNGTSTSQIDLFIHHYHANIPICTITIQSRDPTNTSMHDPVTATLMVKVPSKKYIKDKATSIPTKTCWDKMDKEAYYNNTDNQLKALSTHLNDTPPTVIADRLHQILRSCADASSPPTIKKRRRKSKQKWLKSFKPLAKAANLTYRALMRVKPEERKSSTEHQRHKAAKQKLRQAQRQAAAKQRQEKQTDIIQSCQNNSRENFYKLIRQARQAPKVSTTIDYQEHRKDNDQDSWASYFEGLATPKDDENFDNAYYKELEITHLLQYLNNNQGKHMSITTHEVSKYIASLKNRKAADIHGITSEHLKYASQEIIQIIAYLSNEILKLGKLPSSFKTGIITPVLKKWQTSKPAQ